MDDFEEEELIAPQERWSLGDDAALAATLNRLTVNARNFTWAEAVTNSAFAPTAVPTADGVPLGGIPDHETATMTAYLQEERRERAERQRIENLPRTIALIDISNDARVRYAVRVFREGVVIDEYFASSKEQGMDTFNEMLRSYEQSATSNEWRMTPNTVRRLDFRGEVVMRQTRHRERRIDRRSRRPAEDKVTEDGLTLQIEEPRRTPLRRAATAARSADFMGIVTTRGEMF